MPGEKVWLPSRQKWVTRDLSRPRAYADVDVDAWGLLVSYWRACPDKLLDVLESETALYHLELVQRVIIRAFFSQEEVFITGSRGLTKTYCVLLSRLLQGILYPGIIMQYDAPALKQAASIVSPIYREIQLQYPGLCALWNIVSDAQDNFVLQTASGSVFAISSVRGGSYNSIIAEEVAQEEAGREFDHEELDALLPAVRRKRMINGEPDTTFPNFQHLYITSAGRQQNRAYEYRKTALKHMCQGGSSFVADIPSEVSVLSNIRDLKWWRTSIAKLTPEKRMREMDSIWTGTVDNPIVRDLVLTESKKIMVMEDRHIGDPNAIYVIGYDVSYKDGSENAKCATVVVKLERKAEVRDRFIKSVVYVADMAPKPYAEQARDLKQFWKRFCLDGGEATYLVIDANTYGGSVVEFLHKEMNDGLPPLCCVDHSCASLELPGAVPCIYPVIATAGRGGSHDPDVEMIQYAELEFENQHVKLLITNPVDGVEAYKRKHHLKDDGNDAYISVPYRKTAELCSQIGNLRKKPSGTGVREERISKHINRDMWSALKYALRWASLLETKYVQFGVADVYKQEMPVAATPPVQQNTRIPFKRMGGNRW